MSINWGNSLVVKKKKHIEVAASSRLWVDICKPKSTAEMAGNISAMEEMRAWFTKRRLHPRGDDCLVVLGPSGVGKSTAVELLAKETGFHLEHTYANVSRTPQKMEAIVRKLTMQSDMSILVLDDFESFISETTSMRDILKFARSVAKGGGCSDAVNQTVVIICNDMDKTFEPLCKLSTVVQFDNTSPLHVQKVIRKVASMVAVSSYIPPMDIFFMAHGSTGNICQTINQMQFFYNNTIRPKRKGQKGLVRVRDKCQIDSALRNFTTTHRSSSIDCFTKTNDSVIDYIWAMSRCFHLDVRNNMHRDYPLYFHNTTCATLDKMWRVAEEVSACDCATPDEEDALYDTENKECWGRDNSFAVAHISKGIWELQGRTRGRGTRKKRKIKKTFTFN